MEWSWECLYDIMIIAFIEKTMALFAMNSVIGKMTPGRGEGRIRAWRIEERSY